VVWSKNWLREENDIYSVMYPIYCFVGESGWTGGVKVSEKNAVIR
jgi:hypothetical protein